MTKDLRLNPLAIVKLMVSEFVTSGNGKQHTIHIIYDTNSSTAYKDTLDQIMLPPLALEDMEKFGQWILDHVNRIRMTRQG